MHDPVIRRLLAIAMAWSAAACGKPQESPIATDANLLLGATPEQDLIRADASEASLRAKFGDANVSADSIELGEGERALGTTLFAADSTRRLYILWKDTVARAQPSVVYVRNGSKWRVHPGAGIGTDLRAIERLNGKPFVLYGFGWDYSGTVATFDGGRLDSLWLPATGRIVLVRLSPDLPNTDSLYSEVLGEREYSSSTRGMQNVNPKVYEILFFPR